MAGRPQGLPKTGGRQKGTPNKVTADIKEIAQSFGEEAIKHLVEIARDGDSPPAARVAAVKEILDRGYGKAKQTLEHSGHLSYSELSDEELDREIEMLKAE